MKIHDLVRHAKLSLGRKHRIRKPTRLQPALAIELAYAAAIQRRRDKLLAIMQRAVGARLEQISKSAGIRLDFNDAHDERGRFTTSDHEAVAARFGIPAKAVREVAELSVDQLRARYKEQDHTNNGQAPEPFVRHELGAASLPDWGDPQNAYLEYLREMDPKALKLSEGANGIRQHPTYERYKAWAASGSEAPYISVGETEKGSWVSSNRRRTLVAQDLGQPSIKGWFGPHNKETGLPLKYGDVMRALNERVRHDSYAWDEELDRAIQMARAQFNGVEPPEDIFNLATEYAQQTGTFQTRQLQRSLGKAIGVNVFLDKTALLKRMGAHVKQNVDLISSIDEDYFDDIRKRLTTGIRAGDRVETMRDMIEERYDVTRSRAALIACDQTMKFYGELNREQQTGLGIDDYVWNGMLDNAEREMHLDLEGEQFKWGDPPVTNPQGDLNEPGGDYRCRCTASPVLPRF